MSSPRPGFGDGLKSVFSGLFWLISSPSAWPLALVPITLAVALFLGLGYAAYAILPDWVAAALGPTSSTVGAFGVGALQVLAVALGLLLSLLVGFALAQPLSGPALEALVRRRRAALGAPANEPAPFWVDIGRALQSLLLGYAFGLPLLALLLVLSLVVPAASVVLFPAKLLVSAFTVAWDLCDYPLSVRGLPVGERLRVIWRNKSAVAGFGVALALAGMVPFVLFALLPVGVVAATELLWEVESGEGPA